MTIEPDWVSPPGETIERIMASREIAADDLSECLGMERSEFDSFLEGELRINDQLAELLAENIGSSARFWLSRDARYLEELVRIASPSEEDLDAWVRKFPVSSLRKLGALPMGRGVQKTAKQLLDFFGCREVAEWNARYQSGLELVDYRASQSFEANDFATTAWRRMGEIQAQTLQLSKYSPTDFRELLQHVKKISAFKQPKTVVLRLQRICAEVGVAVTTARSPQGCRASGATWTSETGNPVIHLSFRHMTDDHFWFTFYHEAGHVLLHRGDHVDTDSSMSSSKNHREREANEFAAEMLVPKEITAWICSRKLNGKTVLQASRMANVCPGVIVGQLEHRKIVPHGKYSFLKHRYKWGHNNEVPELS